MDNMTAKISAFTRAYHYKNNETYVFADSKAEMILGDDYAGLFELLGLPFLFLKQNAVGFLWVVLGVAMISIALMIVYNRILRKYELKK